MQRWSEYAWLQSVAVYCGLLVSVVGLAQAMSRLPAVVAQRAQGASVVLLRRCTQQEEAERSDSRDVYLRLRNDGSVYVNEERIEPSEIVPRMEAIYSRRFERVLYLVGESEMSYGRVASAAADLQGQVPDLHILLLTKSNLGRELAPCLVPETPIRWR